MDLQKGILVIDSDLYSKTAGHFYNYDQSIVTELQKRGIFIKVLCSKNLELNEGDSGFMPSLRFVPRDLISVRSKYKIINIFILLKLQILLTIDFISCVRKCKNEIKTVFFPNIDFFNVVPILITLFVLPSKIKALLFYRYTNKSIHRGKRLIYFVYKSINFFFKSRIQNKKFIWVTDSSILAEEGYNDFSFPIQVLPIPHTISISSHPAFFSSKVGKSKIKIYLPGKSNMGKGLSGMLQAIDTLTAYPVAAKIEFYLQNFLVVDNFKKFAADFDLQAVKDKIQNLADQGYIHVLESYLTAEQYYDQLIQSDIILLPYRTEGYALQTSGIFTEAIALGKPVIVTKNTWMSKQLEQNLGSGLTFDEKNYDSLAKVIVEIVVNLEEYTRQAHDKSIAWKKLHSPSSFCDSLLTLA